MKTKWHGVIAAVIVLLLACIGFAGTAAAADWSDTTPNTLFYFENVTGLTGTYSNMDEALTFDRMKILDAVSSLPEGIYLNGKLNHTGEPAQIMLRKLGAEITMYVHDDTGKIIYPGIGGIVPQGAKVSFKVNPNHPTLYTINPSDPNKQYVGLKFISPDGYGESTLLGTKNYGAADNADRWGVQELDSNLTEGTWTVWAYFVPVNKTGYFASYTPDEYLNGQKYYFTITSSTVSMTADKDTAKVGGYVTITVSGKPNSVYYLKPNEKYEVNPGQLNYNYTSNLITIGKDGTTTLTLKAVASGTFGLQLWSEDKKIVEADFELTFINSDITASGTTGDLTWVLYEDGTLVISGDGAMPDYSWGGAPWYSYRESITSLVIEFGVTSIGENAFLYCSSLTSVIIPSGVTSIGNYAFDGCSCLSSIVNPSSVTSIGVNAFSGCSSLTSVEISAGVMSIGVNAFSWCSSLTSINVDEENMKYKDIDGVLFSKDETLLHTYPAGKSATSYVIPSWVTSIGAGAFGGCSSLTAITIPDGVTSIGDGAFHQCTGLTGNLILPYSLEVIGWDAFSGCSGLNGCVTISPNLRSISGSSNGNIFTGCSGITDFVVSPENQYFSSFNGVLYNKELTKLIICPAGKRGDIADLSIPSTVTNIGWGAFYGCDSLTGSLSLPNNVTTIEGRAFMYCSGITSVYLPDSVTSIGNWAFYGCSLLQFVEISDRVTIIDNQAFMHCSNLTSIIVDEGNTMYKDIDGVLFSKDNTLLLIYPEGKSATSYIVPSGVTSIGNWAFYGCSRLSSIMIPSSVASIDSSAFSLLAANSIIYCSDACLLSGKYTTYLTAISVKNLDGSYTFTSAVNNLVLSEANAPAGVTYGGWFKESTFTTPVTSIAANENPTLWLKTDCIVPFIVLNTVNIGIPKPIAGETPATSVTGTGIVSQSVTWSPAVSSTFEQGIQYKATIKVKNASGYVFSSNPTVTVNGKSVAASKVSISGDVLTISDYIIGSTEGTISSVSLAVDAPVAGAKPDTSVAKESSANYDVSSITWYKTSVKSGNKISILESFEGSTVYVAEIKLTAKDGYTFDNSMAKSSVKINDKAVSKDLSFANGNKELTLQYTFPATVEAEKPAITLTADPAYPVIKSGLNSVTVKFTYKITGDFDFASLNFGDNSEVSIMQSGGTEAHTYTSASTFTVIMRAGNEFGTTTKTLTLPITRELFKASFYATTYSGEAPLQVTFTDTSAGTSGKVIQRSWDFGDGTTAASQTSVTHTFEKEGTYYVKLFISDGINQDTATKTITVTQNPRILNSLTLSSGWNFISVPKKLAAVNDTAAELFAGVNTDNKAILIYNAESKGWETLQASTEIKPLNAYWIYAVEEKTITPEFDRGAHTPGLKTLKKGWNAVGLSAENPMPASVAFNGLNWRTYLSWNAAGQMYSTPIIKGVSGTYGEENPVSLYKGGWVYMEEDGTYLGYA